MNLKRFKNVLDNPYKPFQYFAGKKIFRCMSDETYLKLLFRSSTGKKLNLNNPQTFNEKLQWLKLYNRNPEYTMMVDKYRVRKYIAKKLGEEYLIPIVGIWNSFDEINFDELPYQFVLKPNHTSGDVFICKDKALIDMKELKTIVDAWMYREYYWFYREWPYKNIKPKIICEKFMVDESGVGLNDYKFFCFNGEPKIIQVISERNNGHYYLNHFDLEWNKFEIPRKKHKENSKTLKKPKELDNMIVVSKELSKNIPFVRIDLYNTDTGIYFGEITFFPVSGFVDFADQQSDYLFGSWIELPNKE